MLHDHHRTLHMLGTVVTHTPKKSPANIKREVISLILIDKETQNNKNKVEF